MGDGVFNTMTVGHDVEGALERARVAEEELAALVLGMTQGDDRAAAVARHRVVREYLAEMAGLALGKGGRRG